MVVERLPSKQCSKRERNVFAVMGQKLDGRATAFIIADTEIEAEQYAQHELAFVSVSTTILVTESVYV